MGSTVTEDIHPSHQMVGSSVMKMCRVCLKCTCCNKKEIAEECVKP